VFYQAFSSDSEILASYIQSQLPSLTGAENKREIKSNSDYYLLRDNGVPTVIAEICFLSNPSEAELIADENVQEKAAFAVAMGIMQYLYSRK
ncbi:MAG: N-acetylmuramoyl-L-alanine amidase, partial [Clostridiales bacterium]|nr:N-acetylmuramoyl-L-alanine amidase [Clostridiales bacterium]